MDVLSHEFNVHCHQFEQNFKTCQSQLVNFKN